MRVCRHASGVDTELGTEKRVPKSPLMPTALKAR